MTRADLDRVEGLDAVSTQALRRLDDMVGGRIGPEAYSDLVMDFLAAEVLSREPAPEPPGDDLDAAADALLARLTGVLLVEMSRRQGNRSSPGARSAAD